jgi:import inner membrane translocase subunit TIM10
MDVSPVQIAVAEMKGLADTFAKMSDTCWKKCIPHVKEGALTVGEMSCTDRCVSKFLDTHAMIGVELNSSMQKQADQ